MKDDLAVPGLLLVTDVNGDKGHNELFTDGVNRDNGGDASALGGGGPVGAGAGAFLQGAKLRPLIHSCPQWRCGQGMAPLRARTIPRPSLDACQCRFLLKSLPSCPSPLSPLPVHTGVSSAGALVLLPGVHFSHSQINYLKNKSSHVIFSPNLS